MGIESDQLVYDYLSRVGDLAQQQQLSSGARMRLVATLRGEIDRQRGTDGSDSPAVVRRIIGRLGAPGELVAAAAESGDGTVPLPSPRANEAKGAAESGGVPRARRGVLRKAASRKGASPEESTKDGAKGSTKKGAGDAAAASDAGAGEGPAPDWPAASAPHMAGLDQAPSGAEPEWWRIEPGPFGEGGQDGQGAQGMPGAMGPGTAVPGFVGGLESPELFGLPGTPRTPGPRAPVEAEEPGSAEEEEEGEYGEGGEELGEAVEARSRRRWMPRLRRGGGRGEGAARPRLSNPLLLLAAALLVAGAVFGTWLALAGGWLLAYSSRKFSRAEAKWVAMGLPGVVVAGAFVWLWGRLEGRWGEPIAEGTLGDAVADVWPVVVRVAAVASALYLVWRARRLSQ
uniref:Integral membrane protein n=1 Tax=Streptomyces sp. NBC_01401 TaxID=2903854 RepID=A0AAU3GSW5_9ACTN